MLPIAIVSHQTKYRIRLRIPSKKQDATYFEELEHALGRCRGVREVTCNARTASVLVHHENIPQEVIKYAEQKRLFMAERQGSEAPAMRLSDRLNQKFVRVNQAVSDLTQREIGIKDMAFFSLVGLSAFQVFQKKILPPSVTLLWYAVSLHLLSKQPPSKRENSPLT